MKDSSAFRGKLEYVSESGIIVAVVYLFKENPESDEITFAVAGNTNYFPKKYGGQGQGVLKAKFNKTVAPLWEGNLTQDWNEVAREAFAAAQLDDSEEIPVI